MGLNVEGLDVEGQRVLVTGASSGIGAGLATALAEAGARVGVCARREERLAEVLERCRAVAPDCHMWPTDLGDAAAVDRLVAAVQDAFGGVDILVNNAGVLVEGHASAIDPAAVESAMRLNFFAPVRLMAAFVPGMVARGGGRVVNISSVAATLSSPGEAPYDASKAALSVFSEAANIDLWDSGVRLLVVYPGIVDTELFDVDPADDPRKAGVDKISVDEVVVAVLGALAEGRRQLYVPGYFEDLARGKAADVEGFLAGAAEFVRTQQVPDLG